MAQHYELTGNELDRGFELALECNEALDVYLSHVAQLETPESLVSKLKTTIPQEGKYTGFKYLAAHFPAAETLDETDRAAYREISEASFARHRALLFAAGALIGKDSPYVDNSKLFATKELV